MAKHKYERKTVVDGMEYDFIEMAKQAVGTEVHFKSDLIEE